MSLMIELDSISSVIETEYPSSTVKYEIPKSPTSDTFVIRSQTNDISSESGYHMLTERTFQFIYYHDDIATVLNVMDQLSRKCMDGKALIPMIDGSLRYIRVKTFGFGQPIKTEGDMYAIIGVMPTEIRTARSQETYDKIMNVSMRLSDG